MGLCLLINAVLSMTKRRESGLHVPQLRHILLEDKHTNCTIACTVVTMLVYCVKMADEDQHICACWNVTLHLKVLQYNGQLAGHVHMHATEDSIKI